MTQDTEALRHPQVAAQKRSRVSTRAKLLAASRSVFADVGIKGASVSQIAQRAGFTRGAFYSNFDSKDSVLLALLDEVASEQIGAVRSQVRSFHVGEQLDWGSQLRSVLNGVSVPRQSVLLLVEMQLHAVRSPAFGQQYVLVLRRLEGEVSDAIREFAATTGVSLGVSGVQASRTLCSLWLSSAIVAAADGSQAPVKMPEECHALARSLFTDYLFAFEITSVLLILAVVGALSARGPAPLAVAQNVNL